MTKVEHLLFGLSEECDEVGQRCSKAARFGLTEVQPGQTKQNGQRIMEELADLFGIYEMLVDHDLIPEVNPNLVQKKKDRFEEYLKLSDKQGTLTGE